MELALLRFPDSPEGVALALAYLIRQERREKRLNEPQPDLITLYQQCLAVVTGEAQTKH
jgi:hypothetical protein